ncbi:MAG: response regulator [Candidatus Moranbacteria bacterium]|nr:response regulator [Candidatus Moranbacteria bacterium]
MKKILVVDDEENIRFIMSLLLSKTQLFTVLLAKNGNEALEIIDENKDIRCVISDIMMPEMGGIQLYQHLKCHNVDIPFIFMSGYNESGDAEIINENNLIFFTKPFSFNNILKEVEKLIFEQDVEVVLV